MSNNTNNKRIVSMLPSAAETIALCGGESMLVGMFSLLYTKTQPNKLLRNIPPKKGRGHEDDFPSTIKSLPIVTGSNTVFTTSLQVDIQVSAALSQGNALYTIDAEQLKSLKPTHIVTQDLCHVCAIDLQTVERIAQTMDPKPEIITLNPLTFSDVLEDITRIGGALGLSEGAATAVAGLNKRISQARSLADAFLAANGGVRKRCWFVEWTDPVYPGGHWTPQLMYMAGGNQPIAPATDSIGAGPSVRVTHEMCVESDPEVIVICPCGLDLAAARREADLIREKDWFKAMALKPGVRVCIVDGNQMFNRPGPRLVDALEFLVGFIWDKDELVPKGFPWEKYHV
ncbi:hypothetical protein BDR26DRAFT_24361 [Obelidium mucronatum]|nr:hypothetical protein BDR26DRAFT_24361 [Obelidium mucronatum]